MAAPRGLVSFTLGASLPRAARISSSLRSASRNSRLARRSRTTRERRCRTAASVTPAPAGAGREAWIIGGGDNAEVVYARPR